MFLTQLFFCLVLFQPGGDLLDLAEGKLIEADGKAISVEIGHLAPCVVDWNNDGRKDLVVGQFKEGNIRLYLNEGSDAEPLFNSFEYLEAGGEKISLAAG